MSFFLRRTLDVPVHKKENRADYANYRPITLLLLLCKVMEHVVHEQLKCYLEEQHTIDSAQHSFRSKRSCCSALLELSNNLSTAKNAGLFLAVAALDYTQAFDTINYSLLLNKLERIGFDKNAVTWFSSYLFQRQQYMCYNGIASDLMPVSHDVPQGSKMGSTLFLLYINDLFPDLPVSSVIAYADDVTLVASDVSATAATAPLQRFLNFVSVSLTNSCLRLNPSKFTFMCIASTKQKAATCGLLPGSTLNISGSPIRDTASLKILSVTFTVDLDCRQHVRNMCSKMSQKLVVLCRISSSLNMRSRALMLLCTRLVSSHIWSIACLYVHIVEARK